MSILPALLAFDETQFEWAWPRREDGEQALSLGRLNKTNDRTDRNCQ